MGPANTVLHSTSCSLNCLVFEATCHAPFVPAGWAVAVVLEALAASGATTRLLLSSSNSSSAAATAQGSRAAGAGAGHRRRSAGPVAPVAAAGATGGMATRRRTQRRRGRLHRGTAIAATCTMTGMSRSRGRRMGPRCVQMVLGDQGCINGYKHDLYVYSKQESTHQGPRCAPCCAVPPRALPSCAAVCWLCTGTREQRSTDQAGPVWHVFQLHACSAQRFYHNHCVSPDCIRRTMGRRAGAGPGAEPTAAVAARGLRWAPRGRSRLATRRTRRRPGGLGTGQVGRAVG